MKKPIHLSNLAMRFYSRYGWTLDELDNCLSKGCLVVKDEGDPFFEYFILSVGSSFDPEALRPLVSHIVPTFEDQPTDFDTVIKEFNW